jgi:TRAP-type C4-dicarboxylate transport system substrate-binding protein
MKNKIAFILFALCLFLSLPLTFAQDDPVTLRLAVADAEGRPSTPFVLEFIEQVTTLSNGSITIEPIWGAGYDTAAYFEAGVAQLVMAGEAELGLTASRAWDNEGVTSLQALQAPFLITNDALAEAVAASDIAARMLEGMSSAGVVGLTLWPEDLRHPFAFEPFGKTFLSPEDFAGTTIRAIPSSVTWALIEALGATPIFKDNYGPDILAGRIQGAESGLRQGASLPVPATATGNVVFFPKFQVLFANGEAFERLSDEQRAVLREAATATQERAIAEHPREADAAAAWCADGGTIVLASDEQVAAFEEAAQPVFEQIEQDPLNAELIAAIRELKASTEPSPGAEACGLLSYRFHAGFIPPDA